MTYQKPSTHFQCEYNEKRNYQRMAIEAPVIIQIEGYSETIAVVSRNFTSVGISFQTQHHMRPGMNISLEVSSSEPKYPNLKAKATVLRTDKTPDQKAFHIAAKITQILS